MRNGARALPTHEQALSLDWILRRYRSVTVTVLDDEREVDSFRASSPWLLRAALQPIYRHLEPKGQMVRFSGVDERWLPGGFRRRRTEVGLTGITAALAFLAGSEER